MLRTRIVATFLGLLIAGASASAAEAARSPKSCETAVTNWLSQYRKGDEFVRDDTVNKIAARRNVARADRLNNASPPTPTGLHDVVDQLQRCYDARAGRQQTWLDGGAYVVLLGTTGALLSAGAGATTQGYWTGAGLAPGVVAQFNAYEPTRDLFHSGGEILSFLTRRHDLLETDFAILSRGQSLAPQPFAGPCAELSGLAVDVAAWEDSDRVAILPEVERLQVACADAVTGERLYQNFQLSAQDWKDRLVIDYAEDVLLLDRQLRVQDRALRYTPLQAISALAASPFLTIGSVLSSEDHKNAVEALKAHKAVGSIAIRISPLMLSDPPALMTSPSTVSGPARARLVVKRPAKPVTTRQQVQTAIQKLEFTQRALSSVVPDFNRRAIVSQRLSIAARGGVLGAEFNPETRAIQVVLRDPKSPTVAVTN